MGMTIGRFFPGEPTDRRQFAFEAKGGFGNST